MFVLKFRVGVFFNRYLRLDKKIIMKIRLLLGDFRFKYNFYIICDIGSNDIFIKFF